MFSIHITGVTLTLAAVAYFLGSLSSAVMIAKAAKLPDPRKEGSENPGATNMLRLGGKKLAALTLFCDMAKGALAILLGRLFAQSGFNLSLIAVCVFIGHIYPVFFCFKGGKGVATALGTLLALSPIMGLTAAATWLIVAAVFRYSSLSALIMAILTPLYAVIFHHAEYVFCLVLIALLIIWRHRGNIDRLRKRTEKKIGEK